MIRLLAMREINMRTLCILLAAGACCGTASAAPEPGPVIEEFGPVYYVPDEPLDVSPDTHWKVVFDVAGVPEEQDVLNHRIETVARFLNMHARAGIDPDRIEVAIVFHGRATRAILNQVAFERRYGRANPDRELLDALTDAGVSVYVCGQSAAAYGFDPAELVGDAKLSLSAMTALVRLQSDGYALIPWGAR
jgi:intracellular sulfur oxidation DsrE/DsrF family protein